MYWTCVWCGVRDLLLVALLKCPSLSLKIKCVFLPPLNTTCPAHHLNLPVCYHSCFYLQFVRYSLLWPFLFEIFFILCLGVLPIWMSLHRSVQYTLKSEKGVKSPGTGARDGCDPPCRCWELNSGSFGRTASALNLWAVSPTQHWHFQWVFLLIM